MVEKNVEKNTNNYLIFLTNYVYNKKGEYIMKNEDLQKNMTTIEQKLGAENNAKIADDLAVILTDNMAMNTEIEGYKKEIEKLKNDKDMLIQTNGNLLLKVKMGFEEPTKPTQNSQEDNKPKYNLKDAFDEKGNFKI